jgi:hypothetical protein
MKGHHWARVLAHVSGLVNQQLLLQVEYLAAENRILRAHLPDRLRLTNEERSTLAEIGKRLGRKGLEKVLLPPDRKRFWAGSEGSLLRSSMAPSAARIPGGQLPAKKWSV